MKCASEQAVCSLAQMAIAPFDASVKLTWAKLVRSRCRRFSVRSQQGIVLANASRTLHHTGITKMRNVWMIAIAFSALVSSANAAPVIVTGYGWQYDHNYGLSTDVSNVQQSTFGNYTCWNYSPSCSPTLK
jgi:hypothetical protein